MATGGSARWTTGNSFLDSLPDGSAALVLPSLTETRLEASHVLANPGVPLESVTFPKRSVISAVTRMRDGTDVEVTLIGREGFLGLQSFLGDGVSTSEAMVQLPDSAYVMPTADFLRAAQADAVLNARVLRYAQSQLETIAQFSGCNRLHQLHERCARWLLMVQDRTVSDDLLLTHEFAATMLGVRRAGVTLALQTLERAGLIAYTRGRISIQNRPGLELVSCECYMLTSDILERLMGYRIRGD